MNYENRDIVAGIVTYNPDLHRLEANIKSIYPQVAKVCVIDNGSDDISEIEVICIENSIEIIKNEKNEGIGFALNQMMEFAVNNNALWCVTLDQDSISPDNLIDEARKYINFVNIGAITPTFIESKTGEKPSLGTPFNNDEYQYINKCITSATITNVSIWNTIGGFDERFFIDYVDYDYAARLICNGYKILRMNNVYLDHELGDSEYRLFLFKKIRVGNHSSFRKYYICRNIIVFIRKNYKHISKAKEFLRLIKVFVLVVLYETDKREKLKACFKGIRDGMRFVL